jgi:hypothetical protein
MRIDSSGNLLVGTTSYDSAINGFGASSSGGPMYATATAQRVQILNRRSSDGEILNFRKDGTTVGSIGSVASGANLYMSAASGVGLGIGGDNLYPVNASGASTDGSLDIGDSTARFQDLYLSGSMKTGTGQRTVFTQGGFYDDAANGNNTGVMTGGEHIFLSNGSGSTTDNGRDIGNPSRRIRDIYVGGGVYLGGTGSANKLDDYEEGTWVPTLPSGGTVTSTAGSVYTKIGNVVYYQMFMQMSGIPNNSTAFYVGGLPFQPSTSGGRQLHGHSTITYINNVDGSGYGAGLNDTNSRVYWHSKVNANQLTNSNFTNVTQLLLAGFYYTA